MKNIHIIALVAGASLVTFILSVVFSINMVSITPEHLAKIIKKDPEVFISAIKTASEKHQKQAEEKALEEQFKNPADIDVKGRVTVGDSEAPITLVEFLDFQCFYCSKASKRVKSLVEKYDGKLKLVYKHLPLDFHPFAKPAAEYFEAIALISHEDAKKFHDAIFDDWKPYAKLKTEDEIQDSLKALVKKLEFDKEAIEKNMEEAKKVVAEDVREAQRLNVGGTPSFFVNGVDTKGRIEQVIEKFLEQEEKK